MRDGSCSNKWYQSLISGLGHEKVNNPRNIASLGGTLHRVTSLETRATQTHVEAHPTQPQVDRAKQRASNKGGRH